MPRVDEHLYARENGLVITGLAALYAVSGDDSCLTEARRAAAWVTAQRALPGGGFRHDTADAAGPYLADTLAMGRAFLALSTWARGNECDTARPACAGGAPIQADAH